MIQIRRKKSIIIIRVTDNFILKIIYSCNVNGNELHTDMQTFKLIEQYWMRKKINKKNSLYVEIQVQKGLASINKSLNGWQKFIAVTYSTWKFDSMSLFRFQRCICITKKIPNYYKGWRSCRMFTEKYQIGKITSFREYLLFHVHMCRYNYPLGGEGL